MGGSGSGRHYQHGKRTTRDMLALDVRYLHRDGKLTPGQSWSTTWQRNGEELASIQMRTEVDRVILDYRILSNGGEWRPMNYPVYLEWTGCTLGGRRAWFLCPTPGCGRRVAILYGGANFACRHCHNLAYPTQRETDDGRTIRRTDDIRRRLGWEVGFLSLRGGKPKGMHWRTFRRIKVEHDALTSISRAIIERQFALMHRLLACLGLDGPNGDS